MFVGGSFLLLHDPGVVDLLEEIGDLIALLLLDVSLEGIPDEVHLHRLVRFLFLGPGEVLRCEHPRFLLFDDVEVVCVDGPFELRG